MILSCWLELSVMTQSSYVLALSYVEALKYEYSKNRRAGLTLVTKEQRIRMWGRLIDARRVRGRCYSHGRQPQDVRRSVILALSIYVQLNNETFPSHRYYGMQILEHK
jgi:hypothetical protein